MAQRTKSENYKTLHRIVAELQENELFWVLDIADLSEGELGKYQIGSMIKHNPSLFGLLKLEHLGTNQWQPFYLKPVKERFPQDLLAFQESESLSKENCNRIVSYIKETGFCESPRFLTFDRASLLLKNKHTEYERFPVAALKQAALRRVKLSDGEESLYDGKSYSYFHAIEHSIGYNSFKEWINSAEPEFDSFVKKTGLPVAKLYGVEILVYHPQILARQIK